MYAFRYGRIKVTVSPSRTASKDTPSPSSTERVAPLSSVSSMMIPPGKAYRPSGVPVIETFFVSGKETLVTLYP